MENILENINNETQDQEIKNIIESIENLDLSAEDMESNLIKSKLFEVKKEKEDDN